MALSTPTIVGIPWDAQSSFIRGAAAAPPLVRRALFSPASNLWTEDLVDLGVPGRLADAGDLGLPESADPVDVIENAIGALMDRGATPLAIGGDHAMTYPILRAVGARHPGLTILHVDAHPDLYDEFEGSRLSHACPFARIMEAGLAAHLVQIGIRAMNAQQHEQAQRFRTVVIDMRAWAAGVRPVLAGPLYVSIDLDGLDPAFAPGVSHREPGGLSVRDVIALVQALPSPPVGADVVEFNPSQDAAGLTAQVAAKLVKELAGRMLESGAPRV
jgi:agmatinase